MEKLLIVDGHNLLFQMFYGMPSRIINIEGKAIQGVLGFTGALRKIINMTNPSHIFVVFDGEHANFRSQADTDYKKNRVDYSGVQENENPFSQLGYIYKVLDVLKISYIEEDEFEADDIIAAYTYKYGNRMKIVISSFDSDFFQLIDENVSVLRYRGKNTAVCGIDYVKIRYGILPKYYADFKSLTGDTSDNIKGADGIGAKRAKLLIDAFGGIENVLSRRAEIENAVIRNSIELNKDKIMHNYKLIKLSDIGKIPRTADELIYLGREINTVEVLEKAGLRIK